jgi:hypothetical protein
MSQQLWKAAISSTAVALCLCVAPALADAVTDWNETAVATVMAEKTNPTVASRNMALVHGALFEAVNAITGSFAPYKLKLAAPSGASPDAAAAAAAYRVLLALYPTRRAELDAAYAAALTDVPESAARSDGVAIGEKAAAELLKLRSDDGADAIIAYAAQGGPGVWQPASGETPLTPHWGKVRPWFLDGGSQFRPAPPPKLDSAQFARDFKEVKGIGGKTSQLRTEEQTDIARFWTPPGVPKWNPVARQLSAANGLSLAENARLFALLNLAAADALIACYDAKYAYNFWRPIAAIRAGAAGEAGDSAWEAAVPTPPFPAYVSGHACYAGAAQIVLESRFGADKVAPLTLTSATAPGVVRRYLRIKDIVDEVSNARVWGGIHWRTDQVEGEVLGRKVGDHAVRNFLRPASVGAVQ